jgi:hypothetical protein
MPAFGHDNGNLAKKLTNQVASLTGVTIQANYDENPGADGEGSVCRINR